MSRARDDHEGQRPFPDQPGLVSGSRVVITPPPRPRTLANLYLKQAIDALRDSGSSDALYDREFRAASAEERIKEWVYVAAMTALEQRSNHSRTAMLFAALAAEAYVNEFSGKHFSGQDLETMDRLPPVEKYAVATRLALGRPIFDRGEEPIQTLRELFRQRDLLVHPKPEKGLPNELQTLDADPVYNPRQAARMIVAVAEAARRVVREGVLGDGFDMAAHMILQGQEGLRRYAEVATQRLPMPDDEPSTERLLADAVDPERRKRL